MKKQIRKIEKAVFKIVGYIRDFNPSFLSSQAKEPSKESLDLIFTEWSYNNEDFFETLTKTDFKNRVVNIDSTLKCPDTGENFL